MTTIKKKFVNNNNSTTNNNTKVKTLKLRLRNQVVVNRLDDKKNLEIKKERFKDDRRHIVKKKFFVPGFNLFFLGPRNSRMNKKMDIFVTASGQKEKFTDHDALTQMYLAKLSNFAVKRKWEEVLSKKKFSRGE